MGFSLGAAQVLIHGAKYNDVDKIIAVSAPSDFDKIENQIWRKEAFIPTFKKFELKRWVSIRPSFIIHKKIKPIDNIKEIKVPTLFYCGEKKIKLFFLGIRKNCITKLIVLKNLKFLKTEYTQKIYT